MRYSLQPATTADTFGWDICTSLHPSLAYLPHWAVSKLADAPTNGEMQGTVIVDGQDGVTLVVVDSGGDYLAQWHVPTANRKLAQTVGRALVQRVNKHGALSPQWLTAQGWVRTL